MTKKLTFDIKKKRWFVGMVIVITVLVINFFISTKQFQAKAGDLSFSNVKVYGNIPTSNTEDWNTVIQANVKSNNIFMKPNEDSFLVSGKSNDLRANMTWSFDLFNVFTYGKTFNISQTTMLDSTDKKINFYFDNAKQKITTDVY